MRTQPQIPLGILALCCCAVGAAAMFRHRWRKGKDAALRRQTQGRASMAGANPYALNQVYQPPDGVGSIQGGRSLRRLSCGCVSEAVFVGLVPSLTCALFHLATV